MRAGPPLLAAALGLLAGCTASGASVTRIGPPTDVTGPPVTVSDESTVAHPDTTSMTTVQPGSPQPAHPVLTDNRVYLLGDSITESISSRYSGAVCDALRPLGWNVTVDAVQGRNTGQAIQSLRSHRSGVGQVLVVLIGHNDGLDPDTYRNQIAQLIALVPDARRIVLLTNYEFEKGRDRMNAVLRDIAALDGDVGPGDRVELVEWNAELDALDGAIQGDGLHLTSVGQQALAGTIALALGGAPAVETGQTARQPSCTTLRNPTSSGSGGGGGGGGKPTTTRPSGGSGQTTTTTGTAGGTSAPPTTGPPGSGGGGPGTTSGTTTPTTPTTDRGKPPGSSAPPPVSSAPAPPPSSSPPGT